MEIAIESSWAVFDYLQELREEVRLGEFVPCDANNAFSGRAKKILDKGRITSNPNYSFFTCSADGNPPNRSIISYQAVSTEGQIRRLYFVTNNNWYVSELNALYCHMVLYEDESGKIAILNQFSPCDFLFDPLKNDSGFEPAYGRITSSEDYGDIEAMDKKSYVAIADPDKNRKYLNFTGMGFDIYRDLGSSVLHELGHAQYMRAVITSLDIRESYVYGMLLNAIHSAISQFPVINFSKVKSFTDLLRVGFQKQRDTLLLEQ